MARVKRGWSRLVPRVSEFSGITIALYYSDHEPPHFHAIYGEYEATVRIEPPIVLEGALPPRVRRLVLLWARSK